MHKNFSHRSHTHTRPPQAARSVPLTDTRYAELLKAASQAFAAEDPQPITQAVAPDGPAQFEQERAFAIREIKAAMYAFGVTFDDLS